MKNSLTRWMKNLAVLGCVFLCVWCAAVKVQALGCGAGRGRAAFCGRDESPGSVRQPGGRIPSHAGP